MRKIGTEQMLQIVTVVVLLGVGVFFGYRWWSDRGGFDNSAPKTFEEAAVGEAIPGKDEREVVDIAEDFVRYYKRAVSDTDEEEAIRAKDLLSQRGRQVIEITKSPVDGLKKFTLGLSAPNDIVILETVRQSENFAEVASRWEYDSETLDRYFYFTKEDDEWVLDSIQLMQQ